MLEGLAVPKPAYVGNFRGESGLERTRVFIGPVEGVRPRDVAAELARFERTLQAVVAALDARYPEGQELDTDGIAAVTDLAGWAHAEWVRIHPFANGSGRTARLWANFVLVRYGLPPVMRLRPRPNDDPYAQVAQLAMRGRWQPTAEYVRRLLGELPRG